MYTIYKFEFTIADVVEIEMPAFAQIIHVAYQGDTPCIWAKVDPSKSKLFRRFYIIGTGHPINRELGPHLATLQNGPFIWHIFSAPENS